MSNKVTPRDREELLRRIQAAWNDLEDAVGGVDQKLFLAGPTRGGWSAKDHLAHISVWLKVIAARIQRQPEHPVFEMDQATFRKSNVDELNEAAYRLNRDRSFEDVIAELKSLHARVISLVESLGEADLARPTWSDQPSRGQLIDNIVGDTYEHYQEHVADIRTLLGRRG